VLHALEDLLLDIHSPLRVGELRAGGPALIARANGRSHRVVRPRARGRLGAASSSLANDCNTRESLLELAEALSQEEANVRITATEELQRLSPANREVAVRVYAALLPWSVGKERIGLLRALVLVGGGGQALYPELRKDLDSRDPERVRLAKLLLSR
jgi:hypothetical protein